MSAKCCSDDLAHPWAQTTAVEHRHFSSNLNSSQCFKKPLKNRSQFATRSWQSCCPQQQSPGGCNLWLELKNNHKGCLFFCVCVCEIIENHYLYAKQDFKSQVLMPGENCICLFANMSGSSHKSVRTAHSMNRFYQEKAGEKKKKKS